MYNLLIAGALGALGYALGAFAAGWVAGLIPAALAFAVGYFLLARRTGRQVEAIFKRAMEQLQTGQLEAARETMRSALPLGKWQVLVESQVHSQIGALHYLDGARLAMGRQMTASKEKFAEAKGELKHAWSRDWRGRTLLAICHYREGDVEGALATLKAAESGGSSEVMFWATWTWVLNDAKRRDEALQVVARGLAVLPKQAGLLAMQEAMSNRKRPDMTVFGEAWYQFYPEHIPQEVLIEQARAAGKLPQQAANRSPMTWPQPRR